MRQETELTQRLLIDKNKIKAELNTEIENLRKTENKFISN